MVLSCAPLLLQGFRHLVLIVNFIDRDPLICKVQNLIVQVCIGITLGAHYLLNSLIAPPGPVMRRHHNFGFCAKSIQGQVYLPGPLQGISDQGTA